MNGVAEQSLQNVLSISTAANNRYLLHFNSLHSLTQWTAGIRLAMYEHASLQEAYTGSIIAGKGRHLNGIKNIMERTRFPVEDWVRVRFGAGTPWRRCWCVISPPTEKDVAKAHKAEKSLKKRSAYERPPLVAKGDIKFYENRKITKKTKPIATITDAFSAYAVYPQNKDLIDQSTLMKVEGSITIHSEPPSTTEGFVFIMPEGHPMVTGFEMMLRFIIPSFDVFTLYGRPNRLIADANNVNSLMFAMPSGRRYGYLELIDVAGLIHTEGSGKWNEREWKKQLKALTLKRMAAPMPDHRRNSSRNSLPSSPGTKSASNLTRPVVRFGENSGAGFNSLPPSRTGSPAPQNDSQIVLPHRTDSPGPQGSPRHFRSASDAANYNRTPPRGSRLSMEVQNSSELGYAEPPQPPIHGLPSQAQHNTNTEPGYYDIDSDRETTPELDGAAMPDDVPRPDVENVAPTTKPLIPVAAPPAFAHSPRAQPVYKPMSPQGRTTTNNLDPATLAQIHESSSPDRRRQQHYGPPPGASINQNQAYGQSSQYGGNNNSNGYVMGQSLSRSSSRDSLSQRQGQVSQIDHLNSLPGMPAMLPERMASTNQNSRPYATQTQTQQGQYQPQQGLYQPQYQPQPHPFAAAAAAAVTQPQQQPQQPQYHQSGTSTPRRSNMASQTLPTIPGTPAAMEQNFQLPDMSRYGQTGYGQNVSREVSRDRGSRERSMNRGSGEVVRKAVGTGSRGVSPNVGGRYDGSR